MIAARKARRKSFVTHLLDSIRPEFLKKSNEFGNTVAENRGKLSRTVTKSLRDSQQCPNSA